jgi:hypothetical protein
MGVVKSLMEDYCAKNFCPRSKSRGLLSVTAV